MPLGPISRRGPAANAARVSFRLPLFDWLSQYRVDWLRPDVLAGLTTAAVVIPKAMAYATVAGLKTTQLSINGDAVAITNKGSGGWRELLSGAGVRSVSVAASGIFTGSAAEAQVKGLALTGALEAYELSFESGDRMRGKFLVTRLEYAGDFNGERNYTLALESSGEVVAL